VSSCVSPILFQAVLKSRCEIILSVLVFTNHEASERGFIFIIAGIIAQSKQAKRIKGSNVSLRMIE